MPDTPPPAQPAAPDARPNRHAATSPPAAPPGSAIPGAPADPPTAPRTPDEYMEEPGHHRRGDGAATDVGA
jgi:hypothetical protein